MSKKIVSGLKLDLTLRQKLLAGVAAGFVANAYSFFMWMGLHLYDNLFWGLPVKFPEGTQGEAWQIAGSLLIKWVLAIWAAEAYARARLVVGPSWNRGLGLFLLWGLLVSAPVHLENVIWLRFSWLYCLAMVFQIMTEFFWMGVVTIAWYRRLS